MQYSKRHLEKMSASASFQSPKRSKASLKNSGSNKKKQGSPLSNSVVSPESLSGSMRKSRADFENERTLDRSISPHSLKVFSPDTLEELKRKREELKVEAQRNEKVIFLPREKRVKSIIRHESELVGEETQTGKLSSFEVIGSQKFMDIADEKELKMRLGGKGFVDSQLKVIEEKPFKSDKPIKSGERYIREKIVDTIGLEVVQRPGLALTPIEQKHLYEFKTKDALELFLKDQNRCKVQRRNEYANRNKSRVRKVKRSEIERLRERGTILARELNNDEMSPEGRDERVKALLEINKKYQDVLQNENEDGSGSFLDLGESDYSDEDGSREKSSSKKKREAKLNSEDEEEPHFGFLGPSSDLAENDKAFQEPENSNINKKLCFQNEVDKLVNEKIRAQGKKYRDEIRRLRGELARQKNEYDPNQHNRELLEFRESELRAARHIQYKYRQFKKMKVKKSKRGTQTDDGSMATQKTARPRVFSKPFKIDSLVKGKEKTQKGYFETAVHFSFMSQINQMDISNF